MDVLAAKLVTLILLFLIAIVFGLLPVKLLREVGNRVKTRKGSKFRSRGAIFVDCLNCFAGGAFFSTSMLHLLPDVREDVDSIVKSVNRTNDFPFAEFLASVGVFSVMILEQLTSQCRRPRRTTLKRSHSEENVELLDFEKPEDSELTENLTTRNSPHDTGNGVDHQDQVHTRRILVGKVPQEVAFRRSQVTRSLVLLLALSTHTIFEGLAVGLQGNSTDVWTLFSAILLHKMIMSFAAGLRFAESFINISYAIVCILVFAFATPVGIATGMVVTETGYKGLSTKIAAVTLQGLATGTFLYVTFFEILVEQMAMNPSLLKVLAVLFGYSSIAALKIFVGD